MSEIKNKVERIRQLVGTNNINEAIKLLNELTMFHEDNNFRNSVIILSSQYALYSNEKLLNTDDDIFLRNKTIQSFLELVSQIELHLNNRDVSDNNKITPVSKADEWFRTLMHSLKNTKNVKVYLRNFGHPDEALEKRKTEVLLIMKHFARLIYENSETVRIVGYLSVTKTSKSPERWLIDEIASYRSMNYEKAEKLVKKCVTVLDRQPTNNSNSVYMFDNSHLLYSYKRKDEIWEFYEIELYNSIIPYFIDLGFQKMIEKII